MPAFILMTPVGGDPLAGVFFFWLFRSVAAALASKLQGGGHRHPVEDFAFDKCLSCLPGKFPR